MKGNVTGSFVLPCLCLHWQVRCLLHGMRSYSSVLSLPRISGFTLLLKCSLTWAHRHLRDQHQLTYGWNRHFPSWWGLWERESEKAVVWHSPNSSQAFPGLVRRNFPKTSLASFILLSFLFQQGGWSRKNKIRINALLYSNSAKS